MLTINETNKENEIKENEIKENEIKENEIKENEINKEKIKETIIINICNICEENEINSSIKCKICSKSLCNKCINNLIEYNEPFFICENNLLILFDICPYCRKNINIENYKTILYSNLLDNINNSFTNFNNENNQNNNVIRNIRLRNLNIIINNNSISSSERANSLIIFLEGCENSYICSLNFIFYILFTLLIFIFGIAYILSII